MQLIVVIPVRNVVDVDLQIHVFGEPMLGHGIEDPIAGDFLNQPRDGIIGNSGAGGAAGNKVSSYAGLPAPGETLGTPEVEGVARNIGQLGANSRRVVI